MLENEEEDEDITCAYRIPNPFTAVDAVSALSGSLARAFMLKCCLAPARLCRHPPLFTRITRP